MAQDLELYINMSIKKKLEANNIAWQTIMNKRKDAKKKNNNKEKEKHSKQSR